jgi:GTPase SAR1 family protein
MTENMIHHENKTGGTTDQSRVFPPGLNYPGLTQGAGEIRRLVSELPGRVAVHSYKVRNPSAWIVFLGGTGTGKSTLFNAFCGKPLSGTGVERPKTRGPILYAHRAAPIEAHFPFPSLRVGRKGEDDQSEPLAGSPDSLVVLEHEREDWFHLVVADTPDVDSLELENRQVAEDLYLLSDAVVFVTSQEKYADQVPFEYLKRIALEKKPFFILVNKVHEEFTREDALDAMSILGTSFPQDHLWLVPRAPSLPPERVPQYPSFQEFKRTLSQEFSAAAFAQTKKTQERARAEGLKEEFRRLRFLLEEEKKAAGQWLTRLEELHKAISDDFVGRQKAQFSVKSKDYLRQEIRKLFAKYDVLARPRRFIQSILLFPLRVLGLPSGPGKNPRKTLLQIREKIDLSPVEAAVERFNLSVLEGLSPSDQESPLFKALRRREVVLREDEIKTRIWEEQDRLIQWLDDTFQRLSREIPTGKKWGIYSTSVLWGILVISFETAVGGGFTVLDAAIDSALAPFVTKGTVELFAYREIQKIARELAERYQEGLLSVLHLQRDRYRETLESLLPSPDSLEALRVERFETVQ